MRLANQEVRIFGNVNFVRLIGRGGGEHPGGGRFELVLRPLKKVGFRINKQDCLH